MKRLVILATLVVALGTAMPALAAHVWTAGAPLLDPDGAGPATGRTEGACTAVIGDKIYVAYGFDTGVGDTRFLRIYDIASDSWSLGPQAPAPNRSEGYRGVAHGGRLYCIGGRPLGTPDLRRFDPATNTWVTLADMPDARAGTTAAVQGDSIFVFGGRKGTTPCSGPAVSPSAAATTILRYDIAKNAWLNAGNLAVNRSDATAARVGDKIYIFGGCDNSGTFFDSVEVYDPKTATSTLLSATLLGGARANAAAATAQGDIHITGGWRSGADVTPNHVIFDVKTGTFTAGTAMPTHCPPNISRGEHELVAHGDRLFAVAGSCPAFGSSLNNLDILKLNP